MNYASIFIANLTSLSTCIYLSVYININFPVDLPHITLHLSTHTVHPHIYVTCLRAVLSILYTCTDRNVELIIHINL